MRSWLPLTVLLVGCHREAPPRTEPQSISVPEPPAEEEPVPQATPAVPLDLPKAEAWQDVQGVLGITITEDGRVFVNGKETTDDALPDAFAPCADPKRDDLRAVIAADAGAKHGRVIEVLDAIKRAGCDRIAFAVQADP